MKKTKIVATIGPACESKKDLLSLSKAGVNVFRLNFSHGSHSEHKAKITKIRELGLQGAILLDTKGPEIRTDMGDEYANFKKGSKIIFTIEKSNYKKTGKISVNYRKFISDVTTGDTIVIDGGLMMAKVLRKTKTDVICKIFKGSAKLKGKKHINLQGKKVSLDTVTANDWKDIEFGIKNKVDYIALSFTRTAKDIREVRDFCLSKKQDIKIIAKIENFEAVQHLESIVKEADGVMVARGDLACEIPFTQVPRVQRKIIELCFQHKKPVIVATQMLKSLVENATPTRAEVMDVSTAVIDGADAVMLSEETTKGINPTNAVDIMNEIATETEKDFINPETQKKYNIDNIREEIIKTAAKIPLNLKGIDGICIFSKSGDSILTLSNYRPVVPIYAFVKNEKVKNQTSLLYGVYAEVMKIEKNPNENIKNLEKLIKEKKLKIKKYILIADLTVNNKTFPSIQIREL